MISFTKLGQLGRIGNCLFQISATLAHAERNNDIAVFPPWEYAPYFKNPVKQSNNIPHTSQYQELAFHYTPLPYYHTGMNLNGYFQSEKYFKAQEKTIRYQFKFKDNGITFAEKQFLRDNACAIHVRRGDYLTKQDVHPVLTMDYYRQAVYKMKEHGLDIFLVFSDDMPWCKENFKWLKRVVFIEGQTDILDLQLMSCCQSQIIANSSFSWWGAWLNQHQDKKIIAPSKWFATDEHDTKDLIPEEWIVL